MLHVIVIYKNREEPCDFYNVCSIQYKDNGSKLGAIDLIFRTGCHVEVGIKNIFKMMVTKED